MDRNSILLGSTEELNEIKEELLEQDSLRENIHNITIEKQNLEKEIVTEERLVEDTITSTIKKRREELEAGYDKEINNNNNKLKSVRNKRETTKKKAVKNRISQETKEIKEANKGLHKEIRKVFKEKKIPKFCDSTIYYALFCTSEIREFILFAITTVIFIALIPNAICFLFKGFWLWRIVIYIAIIAVFITIYILIFRLTKTNKKEIFEQMRTNRDEIYNNIKKMKKIKKRIRKDSDESQYNLNEFDDEISSLNISLANLEQDKVKALQEFADIAVKAITEEIINRSKDKIKEMKDESVNLSNILKELENKLKDVTLRIASKYEAYLGREFMSVNRIEKLISIINEEKASTIAEAMGILKGQS